jgi:hypothetical protein
MQGCRRNRGRGTRRQDWLLLLLARRAASEPLDPVRLQKGMFLFAREVQLSAHDCLPAHIEVLFAGYSAGHPWVYEVGVQSEDEIHPAGEAIGHARHFPMYLMASPLHYELADRGVEQVKIFAYRAVADAIKTDANSLGLPIHAYIVTAAAPRAWTRTGCGPSMTR